MESDYKRNSEFLRELERIDTLDGEVCVNERHLATSQMPERNLGRPKNSVEKSLESGQLAATGDLIWSIARKLVSAENDPSRPPHSGYLATNKGFR
ncbi:hypothetical protein GCM10010462_09410 [Microbacterium dextranolyticum]|uniref:Uncharacterized protein n=1 Tax=Microbacterium dextranolyticum TaxID=36806 RepID=A0A9W6HJB5_9MICO|nr:hypothetical protein GCM10017591_03860 [Microbacterium dextranolyticum]